MIISNKTQRGFHLLEMLAALVIVGILATISCITYSDYMLRSARTEASIQLEQLSMLLEQHYLEHQAYQAISLNENEHNKHYLVTIEAIDKADYKLIAKPISTAAKKHRCGALLLDAQGHKQITGDARLADCW